jgi:uncharacterized protein (TIGR02145 family)
MWRMNQWGILIVFAVIILPAWSNDSPKLTAADRQPGTLRHQGTVTDVEGNVYHTVRINDRLWLAENLRTTRYRDGTAIPHVADDEAWSVLSTGAYCAPAVHSSVPEGPYGLLYNFHAVVESRGLCPHGWRVPTSEDWRRLVDHLGGVEVAGSKMKATDAGVWRVNVVGTTNESGFSALPAGGRGRIGGAGDVGHYATWWSSTPHDSIYAWHWGLYPDRQGIRSNPGHNASGFSVRCVKN